MSGSVNCQGCGETIQVPDDHKGCKIQCPQCGDQCEVPTFADEEENSDPYLVVRNAEPICPRCQQVMAAGTTVCTACGHDLTVRQTTYKPLVKHWDAGLPPILRRRIFLIGQGLALLSLVIAAFMGELVAALLSWLVYTGMLAFLLGTYDCVDLTRNQRGRVVLTKTWHICFVFRRPVRLRLSEYDSVANGLDRDADMWDWLLLFVLLCFGLIPGIIWWYLAIHCDRFYVALSKGHGAPEYHLYRGTSQKHMEELARTIREAAFPG